MFAFNFSCDWCVHQTLWGSRSLLPQILVHLVGSSFTKTCGLSTTPWIFFSRVGSQGPDPAREHAGTIFPRLIGL